MPPWTEGGLALSAAVGLYNGTTSKYTVGATVRTNMKQNIQRRFCVTFAVPRCQRSLCKMMMVPASHSASTS